MIIPADWPLEAACQRLRALHVGLNSPVVRQHPLPVGPASAAVALHVAIPGASIAIRSVRTGHVFFFTSDPDASRGPEIALDAALSFGEALGFVFDEDEVGPDGAGAEEAARLWCQLIGEEYLEVPEGADPVREVLVDVSFSGPVAATPDPSRVLSKFRWPSSPEGPELHPVAPAAERNSS